MSSLRHLCCEADEERKADIDHHKNDQLKKQEEGKGHWKKELSSNSESAVSKVLNESSEFGECIYLVAADSYEPYRSKQIEKELRMQAKIWKRCRKRPVMPCKMITSMRSDKLDVMGQTEDGHFYVITPCLMVLSSPALHAGLISLFQTPFSTATIFKNRLQIKVPIPTESIDTTSNA